MGNATKPKAGAGLDRESFEYLERFDTGLTIQRAGMSRVSSIPSFVLKSNTFYISSRNEKMMFLL